MTRRFPGLGSLQTSTFAGALIRCFAVDLSLIYYAVCRSGFALVGRCPSPSSWVVLKATGLTRPTHWSSPPGCRVTRCGRMDSVIGRSRSKLSVRCCASHLSTQPHMYLFNLIYSWEPKRTTTPYPYPHTRACNCL